MRESKGAGGLLYVHDKIIAYMPRTPPANTVLPRPSLIKNSLDPPMVC